MEVLNTQAAAVYEQNLVREVTGPAIRPGGFTLTDRAMGFCRFPENSRILDAGCGCGATVGHLRTEWKLDAVGVDVSAKLVSEGIQSGYLPLVRAEACSLPVRSGSMDGLTCECVLSILAKPEEALKEFRRVLKNDGYLIISDIYLRENPGLSTGMSLGNHIPLNSCFFGAVSRDKRRRQIESAGFTIRLWKDHTRLLKELAARFVFEHGSLTEFWRRILPCGCTDDVARSIRNGKPGYCLLIAQKN